MVEAPQSHPARPSPVSQQVKATMLEAGQCGSGGSLVPRTLRPQLLRQERMWWEAAEAEGAQDRLLGGGAGGALSTCPFSDSRG